MELNENKLSSRSLVSFCVFALLCLSILYAQLRNPSIENFWQLTNYTSKEVSRYKYILRTFDRSKTKFRPIICENILTNMTEGHWVKDEENSSKYISAVKLATSNYFLKTVQSFLPWRKDGKCGTSNFQDLSIPRPYWCDSHSAKYCCSDIRNGTCGTSCTCSRCVDTRKILHAELSKWTPSDIRCEIKHYTAEDACRVASIFTEIYFAGDSFIRKMSRAFSLTLTENDAMQLKNIKNWSGKNCGKFSQFFRVQCRLVNGSLLDQQVDQDNYCGKKNLKVYHLKPSYAFGLEVKNVTNATTDENRRQIHENKFIEVVKHLAKRKGSLILLSMGVTRNCSAELIIPRIQLAVDYLKSLYNVNSLSRKENIVWPHIIYFYPDMAGLKKPVKYLDTQGKEPCNKFSEKMKVFCDAIGIPVLDFRQLTTNVHSYDGTHYGYGVNMMKVQMLLNYLDKTFGRIF